MRAFRVALILLFLVLQLPAATAFIPPRNHGVNAPPKSRSALFAGSSAPVGKKGGNVAVAGKLFPVLAKFIITPEKAREIVAGVGGAVDVGDLFLIAIFGWVLLPAAKFIFNQRHKADDPVPDFSTSRLFRISTLISQIAKIFGVVYLVDVLTLFLNVIGIKFPYNNHFSMKSAQLLFTSFAAWRLIPYKKHLIEKTIRKNKSIDEDDASYRIKIYDSVANVLIIVTTIFFLLDELSIPIGKALQSIFALGGVGTLVFSLASKDVAAQVVNGVALASSNKYDEGDFILLGDGTQGTVTKMGLMATALRGM